MTELVLTAEKLLQFSKTVYDYYHVHRRNFAWRQDISPYKILVSEIMLQQTQTSRVIDKFDSWMLEFPDFATLAKATSHKVLHCWQGLGYNRRGLALLQIAQIVMKNFDGILPSDSAILQTFPAIGPNTAGSICAFAFNIPTTFIETNIRTVYSHHFFSGKTDISDKQLMPIIQQTCDVACPREWYYALMDYGVHLKQKLPKINSASLHYVRQSKFEGSKRQIRGAVIKILTEQVSIQRDNLVDILNWQFAENMHNKEQIIDTLIQEKIIQQVSSIIFL